ICPKLQNRRHVAMNRDSCVPGSVSAAVGLMLGITVLAHGHRPRALALTPSEMSWTSQGPLAVPRMAQVNLVGNPLRPGPLHLALEVREGVQDRAAFSSRFPRSHHSVCLACSRPATEK